MSEKSLLQIEDKIERETRSIQPRFKKNSDETMRAIIDMIRKADQTLPRYSSDTRKRDEELLKMVRSEPLLSGVVASAVSRDKNRGWLLTGPARQVSTFSRRLHSVHEGEGWRQFVSLNSHSWYSTNFGYASEIGFTFRNGPAATMWHMDPINCRLTGNVKEPMYYYPANGKVGLKRDEYIHGNSMPSPEEKMKRAGFCAVERCLDFTRLMIGVNRHQLEKLGVAPSKGILLGKGILRDEYDNAVAQAQEDADNKELMYYRGVMFLFTRNVDAALDFIGLSELPDNFELTQFIDVVMQGYALAFGYPVGEFWSIQSGSFGRTGEMKEQQHQATAKGELDFALSFQEQLQTYFLPATVNFQFDQRNDRGDLVRAEANAKIWEIIKEAYSTENSKEGPLITKEQALELMVQHGILPAEMTENEEDLAVTDLKEVRERALSQPEVLEAIHRMPDDPIVVYRYEPQENKNYTPFARTRTKSAKNIAALTGEWFPPGDVQVLWEKGSDALKTRYR